MEFQKTNLQDAVLIKPKFFKDERGFFVESYSKKVFQENGIEVEFVQDNHSMSVEKGVLRGLHFQSQPHAQSKLVRVTKGKVYDVIVDLRKDSSTFKQWQGFELSAKKGSMLFIPKGFAHAFCTLEEDTEFMYKVDDFYTSECDLGIIWNDSELNIDWPIKNPILSEKDKQLKQLKDLELNF
ncbi:MAG: dTDP-4-dehydrorhamnose 3,5-epimerase [Candidatus Moranbacteria bacterium]|nr:dTDP-4-dehydrorhamnose 3,5-epimerase [Candidatus Moranbacteria bacterium]